VHGFLAPEHVVTGVERHGWALDPTNATAETLLFAILGAGRNDDDFVASSRAGLELLVDVRADATAELRIELGYVNDLHEARRICSRGLSVDCAKGEAYSPAQ
jgi:hypothetical protein